MKSSGKAISSSTPPASTMLTPAMARLGKKMESNKGHIRKFVLDALDKQLYSTAVFYSEQLSRAGSASTSDHILCAKSFLLSGEHRRCLATLQHRGLLQVRVLGPLADALRPDKSAASSHRPDPLSQEQLQQLAGLHMAACCLLHLGELEDCLALLESLVHLEDGAMGDKVAARSLQLLPVLPSEIHVVAALYCVAGKCYDTLDHRSRALRAFTTALRIDPSCTEVAEHMTRRGMLSQQEKLDLLQRVVVLDGHPGKEWLQPYYSFTLGSEAPECLDLVCTDEQGLPDASHEVSALSLAMQAAFLYKHGFMEDAFRVAGQAYLIDPFDWRGNLIYIGSMVNLSLKNELFYLGHELVHSHPKHALSWYTVGCYYWTCRKLELAQKYLQKSTKIDKSFAHAWVLLGHVLAAQEESEHAISAYRTACRVSPGDLHPQLAMAKEQVLAVRTGNYSLALHVLTEARAHSPADPTVLNELGVVYMQLDRLQEAMKHLRKAAELATAPSRSSRRQEVSGVVEIISNYGTCLRKCGMLEQALDWYQRCLSYRPNDPMTHANMGFTLHLSRRFDEAIDQYHRALSLQPAFSFCADMLTQALSDMCSFPACAAPPHPFPHQRRHEQQGRPCQPPHLIDALFLPRAPQMQERELELEQGGSSLLLSRVEEGEQSLLSQFSAVPLQDHEGGSSLLHLDQSSRFQSPGSFQSSPGSRNHNLLRGPMFGLDGSGNGVEGASMSWDEEDSVDSYSRVAGRLSMGSAASSTS